MKKDALVPVDRSEEAPESVVEQEYQQAKEYFKESTVQAAKTNVALLTVLGIFVVRGVRYAWEAVSRYVFRKRG